MQPDCIYKYSPVVLSFGGEVRRICGCEGDERVDKGSAVLEKLARGQLDSYNRHHIASQPHACGKGRLDQKGGDMQER